MTALAAVEDGLSPRDFQRLAAFIEDYSGIRMPPSKKTMVEGRLRRRVRMLGVPSLREYGRLLFEAGWIETETVELIDAVTTNKTEFYREPAHFEMLARQVVPDLLRRHGRGRPIRVWSAAASVGAEAYTIAMVLHDLAAAQGAFAFSILATDICTDVLEKAKLAIYPAEMLEPVPAAVAKRYFRPAKDPRDATVRLVPAIRQSVQFGRLNLMDDDYPVGDPMDVVFCRNILIYFDKRVQQQVLGRLCGKLCPGGHLFIGHTESTAGLDLPLRQVGMSAFMRI